MVQQLALTRQSRALPPRSTHCSVIGPREVSDVEIRLLAFIQLVHVQVVSVNEMTTFRGEGGENCMLPKKI